MRVTWHGQSAFKLHSETSIFIDPFGDMAALMRPGTSWHFAPIENQRADVLLVTHEHPDHNAVEVVEAETLIRSRAGTHQSQAGEVIGVASEHDDVAGTARGGNAIYVFSVEGLRICHLGDLGQPALRAEQREAIGAVDLLFLPVGGGPTIGGERAAAVARELEARLVVPMHYGPNGISSLGPPDDFLEAFGAPTDRLEGYEFDVEEMLGKGEQPRVVMPAEPLV